MALAPLLVTLSKSAQHRVQSQMIKSVILQLFQYESRYLLEIFSICSSHVCAKLTTKFLLLLNQPASNGPFRPKLWTALATVFVEIFFRKIFWLPMRRNFEYLEKNGVFKFFKSLHLQVFRASWTILQSNVTNIILQSKTQRQASYLELEVSRLSFITSKFEF